MPDKYTWPGTETLINIPGIRGQAILDLAERSEHLGNGLLLKEPVVPGEANPNGLDEQDVAAAMEFAAGIQGFAGGVPDQRSLRLARRILLGTSTPESAVRRYLATTLPEVQ